MTAIVYRDCPGRKRQYVKRIAAMGMLWTFDRTQAQRMDAKDATKWATVLRLRSTGWNHTQGATEPAGEYGTEDVTP